MCVDEIDTTLLSRTQSLTYSRRKPILQQNYTQMDRDEQEERNSQVCGTVR